MLEPSPVPVPELDKPVRIADPRRRALAVRQLGELFQRGAAGFQSQHIAVFDSVLSALAPATELAARIDLAERLAALPNAPPTVVGQLVRDVDVSVAGPLLRVSPVVDEPTLLEVAGAMGQGHLLAISAREAITESVTDVLVRRGDRDVIRNVAGNDGALFSSEGYTRLVKRAENDGMLAITVGQRDDLPDLLLQQLLIGSADLVRKRLFAAADPARKASIARAMAEISSEGPLQPLRDFDPARRQVVELHRSGQLNKETLLGFAKERKYEETVALLGAVSGLTTFAVDRILSGSRRDSALVLGKALGLDWQTVKAILAMRLAEGRAQAATDVEFARVNFERLSLATAQRVVKFWKERPPQ